MKNTKNMGRPKETNAKLRSILIGATSVFGQKGFAQVRVEDILEKSEVSRRTFYRFFRNKSAVYEAIFSVGVASLESKVLAAIDDSSKSEREVLEAAVGAFIRAITSWGSTATAMLAEARRPGSEFGHLYRRALDRFTDLLQSQVSAAGLGEVDPWLIDALIAATEHVATDLALRSQSKTDHERATRVVMRVLVASLGDPFGTPPPMPIIPTATN